MSDTTTLPASPADSVTLESLARAFEAHAAELAELRERLEDLEDLRELEAAEARALARGEMPEPFDPIVDLGLTPEDIAEEAARHAAERGTADGR